MNANITRHAYANYTGKPYIDTASTPVTVKPYTPAGAKAAHRTIIRNNQSGTLQLPSSDCGCSAPTAFPKHAPISAPKYAPVAAPSPALTPRRLTAPRPATPLSYTAAAPPVSILNDNGKWASSVRKDNLFANYSK